VNSFLAQFKFGQTTQDGTTLGEELVVEEPNQSASKIIVQKMFNFIRNSKYLQMRRKKQKPTLTPSTAAPGTVSQNKNLQLLSPHEENTIDFLKDSPE
jgi:hypothetical protein